MPALAAHVRAKRTVAGFAGAQNVPGATERLAMYRQIVDEYPQDEVTPQALFMVGFIHSEEVALATEGLHLAATIQPWKRLQISGEWRHFTRDTIFAQAVTVRAPATLKLPDPPVAVDYSAQNDSWSNGHDRFVKAMNDRKYALYFYWGPFGHANNHAAIEKVNDLINTFDWLSVKRNEAYPVFANASSTSL